MIVDIALVARPDVLEGRGKLPRWESTPSPVRPGILMARLTCSPSDATIRRSDTADDRCSGSDRRPLSGHWVLAHHVDDEAGGILPIKRRSACALRFPFSFRRGRRGARESCQSLGIGGGKVLHRLQTLSARRPPSCQAMDMDVKRGSRPRDGSWPSPPASVGAGVSSCRLLHRRFCGGMRTVCVVSGPEQRRPQLPRGTEKVRWRSRTLSRRASALVAAWAARAFPQVGGRNGSCG